MASWIRLGRAVLPLILISALLASCGRSSVATSPQAGAVNPNATTPGLVTVKMRPQQPVDPPFSFDARVAASSSPSAMLGLLPPPGPIPPTRQASFIWFELFRNGSQYNTLLP